MANIIPPDTLPAFPVSVPRDGIGDKVRELLGLEPVPEDIDFTAGASREENGIRLTDITYQNSIQETVPGILMYPMDAQTHLLPGVVCLPGTGGSAERVAHERFYRDHADSGPLYGWGRELARRGFATLAISPKGCFARENGCKTPDLWALEGNHLIPYGRTQMGILAEEALRAVRILSAQDGVDGGRVGLTGMSLGGNATWYAMACAPWLRAGVPICGGVGRMASVIHDGPTDRHSHYFFIPHMLRYFDHPDIVAACIPPRPFMMVAPTEDEDMPKAGVDALVQAVKPVYEASGHVEHFKVYQPPGNHCFRFEYFEWMADWFARHLSSIVK